MTTRRNCPRCGASFIYLGRRDLLAVLLDCLETMDQAEADASDANGGDAPIHVAFGVTRGHIRSTLLVAFGECAKPGCAAAANLALHQALERRRDQREGASDAEA